MSNVKLTPATIAIAIVVGTFVGPMSQIAKGLTTAQMTDATYWLDMLTAAVVAFAATAVSILSLFAAAIGWPVLRGVKADAGPGDVPPVGQ